MKTIHWEACITGAPTVARYCKHCGKKTGFRSSGLFRVNAQQKHLDIWLIYRCERCDTTWNLPLFSRIGSSSLPQEVLDKYSSNDSDLAMHHATDVSIMKRSGIALETVNAKITGEDIGLLETVRVKIIFKWPIEIKAAVLIREKLKLSRREFDAMCERGQIVCVSGHDLKKCKSAGEIIFELNPIV